MQHMHRLYLRDPQRQVRSKKILCGGVVEGGIILLSTRASICLCACVLVAVGGWGGEGKKCFLKLGANNSLEVSVKRVLLIRFICSATSEPFVRTELPDSPLHPAIPGI